MNPILTGKMVCWTREMTVRPSRNFVRANQGIRLGDTGLVISQSVTELQILMKDQLVFFHTMEVEEVS